MMFVLGIAAFALCILISVALHECGHMWAARATGMKVRRYFVGFGPTLWSTRRPNKLGETEYGIKAIPAGGFCDIAGMTAIEELTPDERPYAMFKQKTWKRVAVLSAGVGMNFVIGLVLIYGIAIIWGLPNLHPPTTAIVGETACLKSEVTKGQLGDCIGPSPAAIAGIRPGDTVVKVGDTNVANFDEMVTAVRKLDGPTPFVVERDGSEFTTTVDVTQTQRWVGNEEGAEQVLPRSVPSASAPLSSRRRSTTHCRRFPRRSPSPATWPWSWASRWPRFPPRSARWWMPSAAANVIPDADQRGRRLHHRRRRRRPRPMGGVLVLPRANQLRARRHQPDSVVAVRRRPYRHCGVREDPQHGSPGSRHGGRGADELLKLLPATYVILVVVIGYILLTVTADLVNPIRLFQ